MSLHTARVIPEERISCPPAAVHFAGVEKEIDMKTPRIVMPLLAYKDNAGSAYEAVLHQADHQSAPRIKVLMRKDGAKEAVEWMDFSVGSLLGIEIKGEKIQQSLGDGPELASISDTTAFDVAKLALECLPRTAGRFEIVWVPDDGLPF